MAVVSHSIISGASCSYFSCAALLKGKSLMIFPKGFVFSKSILSFVVFTTIALLFASEGLLWGLHLSLTSTLLISSLLISRLLISPWAQQSS